MTVDLADLAPLVATVALWLEPDEMPAALVGLIRSAPAGLLQPQRAMLAAAHSDVTPWDLNEIVLHALVPLAALSLVTGQPAIPELVQALGPVLADPRLSPDHRAEVEAILRESATLTGRLDAESRGCE